MEIERICPNCGGRIIETKEVGQVTKTAIRTSLGFLSGGIGGVIASNLLGEKIDKAVDKIAGSGKLKCENCGYEWTLEDEFFATIEYYDNIIEQSDDIEELNNVVQDIDYLIENIPNPNENRNLIWFGLYRKIDTRRKQLDIIRKKYYDSEDDSKEEYFLSEIKRIESLLQSTFDELKSYDDDVPGRKVFRLNAYEETLIKDSDHRFRYLIGEYYDGMDNEFRANVKSEIQRHIDMIKADYCTNDDELNQLFFGSFNENERRLIFIANKIEDVEGFFDDSDNICLIYPLEAIPKAIKFPLGRPTGNTLYIANPANPIEYVPYDDFENTFFKDKIRELKRLLRHLGATEITFTSMKGKSVDEIERSSDSVSVEGNFKVHKGSADVSYGRSQQKISSRGEKVDSIEKLDPFNKPAVPSNLHWIDSDPEWKDLVEGRLHGNMLHFEQSISTKQVSSLDTESQLNVNAAYENLVFSINAHYNRKREFHVKTSEETMWRITAEFKPLNEFDNSDLGPIPLLNKNNTLNANEQEYVESLKDFLSDGVINDRERRMLDRVRKSLGISEQRAAELEASLAPQLTEDEQEYLDMYREYAEEGEITEKIRNRLDKFASALNISSDRAKELEII